PGLRHTGWGIIEAAGPRLRYVADGTLRPDPRLEVAERLAALHTALLAVIARHRPEAAAVEETFVSRNAASTLKLGLARGVVLLAPALTGLPVSEYPASVIKKSVVGVGYAEKAQVQMMVRRLLPGATPDSGDSADALAVAICHAHHLSTRRVWEGPAAAPLTGAAP
ncbi:MAG: crossover junction endodeoxyribonuclease RuvC, partial [Rhodospirillaceae bacterium]|nr:crossover junction endodeoxyribonuclease RuvC [Rhodospirillaceae bacterium]